MIAFIGPYS